MKASEIADILIDIKHNKDKVDIIFRNGKKVSGTIMFYTSEDDDPEEEFCFVMKYDNGAVYGYYISEVQKVVHSGITYENEEKGKFSD